MVQKGSSNLSVSIIKIRKWCHWPRVLDTSLWGWNFLFLIIFYLSSFACLTGHCSCDLVLYVILNLWLCESNLLVWPSKTLHYPCVGGSWFFFIVSLGVLFNFNWHGNSKGCPHWAFYISVMYVGGFPFPPLPSVPQNYLSQQWWYMFLVTTVCMSERQFNDVFYYIYFFTQQKLNCHETDVRWAIKNGDTHDQLKIAYHLILDNKRMRMLGKFSIGMWPVSLEEQVYKALG